MVFVEQMNPSSLMNPTLIHDGDSLTAMTHLTDAYEKIQMRITV